MQDRIEEIYREKAMMGLGEGGCMNQYLYPSGDGMEFEGNIGGVLVGGARRKLSAYNRFVKAFLNKPANKRKYRNQKTLFKAAAAAWRKSGYAAPKRRKRYGSKTAKRSYTRKRKVGRPRTRRARGRGFEDDEFDFEGDGVLVGGYKNAAKAYSMKSKRKQPYKPSAAQLKKLGLSAADFEQLRLAKRTNVSGFTVPKYSRAQLARMGKRYATKRGINTCAYPDSSGPYFLDKNYDCDIYEPKSAQEEADYWRRYFQRRYENLLKDLPPGFDRPNARMDIRAPPKKKKQLLLTL